MVSGVFGGVYGVVRVLGVFKVCLRCIKGVLLRQKRLKLS